MISIKSPYILLYIYYHTDRLSIWLSVDPLADNMPSWNPYNYCFNQPVIYVDPTGKIPWKKIANSSIIKSNLQLNRTLNNTTRPHQGVDIYAPIGTPCKSAAAGKVLYAGKGNFKDNPNGSAPYAKDGGGWGNYVVIDHGNGIITLYAHLKQNSICVNTGDDIEDGQPIGEIGNSGRSYGQHAHIEAIFNEDGSQKYAGNQYVNGDNKNAHVVSITDVEDLQNVVEGKEIPTVRMLDGSEKTIKISPKNTDKNE